jgi:hypothetical protein
VHLSTRLYDKRQKSSSSESCTTARPWPGSLPHHLQPGRPVQVQHPQGPVHPVHQNHHRARRVCLGAGQRHRRAGAPRLPLFLAVEGGRLTRCSAATRAAFTTSARTAWPSRAWRTWPPARAAREASTVWTRSQRTWRGGAAPVLERLLLCVLACMREGPLVPGCGRCARPRCPAPAKRPGCRLPAWLFVFRPLGPAFAPVSPGHGEGSWAAL